MPGVPRSDRRRLLVVAGAVLALAVAVALVLSRDDDDDATSPTSASSSSTSSSSSSSSSTSSSSTATTTGGAAMELAVWPPGAGTQGLADPAAAARSFAVDFARFVDPVVGPFLQGDSRSGEVEVRPVPDGPATTVLVRQLAADTGWWVIGAVSSIRVDAPQTLATVTSPLAVRGEAVAFEGVVDLTLRADGVAAPVATGFATGGATAPAPFSTTLEFAPQSAAAGSLMVRSTSARDGGAWEVSVLRIRYDAAAAPVSCREGPQPPPDHGPGETVLTVYFHCGAEPEGDPVAHHRVAAATQTPLRASLELLLAGPTPAEVGAGASSWFSAATAGMLERAVVDDEGAATIDLHDLRTVIPNASSSAGSQLLLSELDATVFQFPSVTSVRYRIEGDCEAFNEWLQMGGCDARPRPGPVGED